MNQTTYDRNFYDLFARQVQADPAAIAIETTDGATHTRKWLDEQSARYAHSLAKLGCQRGDRVAAQVEKSPQAIALFLGCVRAGYIFLPLNTAYQSGELAHLLGDSTPRIFVRRPSQQASQQTLATPPQTTIVEFDENGCGELAELAAQASGHFETAACASEDLAALLYTSGTTGKPKGAMLSHRAISYCALSLGQTWQFTQADVLLHALPLFHAHGLFISSNVALVAGAKILFHAKFSADAIIDDLARSTVFMGVPTFYHRLLAEPRLTPEQCRAMRLFTSGSAPLTSSVHREFEAQTAHQIVERYGATETMIITSNPIAGERRPGSVGLPLPGVELRIAGEAANRLPAGEIGMIQMRSPGLFSGYWNMREQTSKEFTGDGYFITGDLGLLAGDGYLSITGRSKDLIISGGYNVYPAELETVISEHAGVSECAVVGMPHADFGEAVVAFVIPRAGLEAPTSEDIVAWTKERLANYKVPKKVFVVDELPRNAMGKVLKNDLRIRLAG